MHDWSAILAELIAGRDLTSDAVVWAMGEVVRGDATPARLAAFLVALRAKGESAGEVAAAADGLLAHAVQVTVPGTVMDIAGTGGDGTGAVNISTMVALVVAATGITVVKHGGRASSSPSAGSGDVIEALGIPVDLTPDQVASAVAEKGVAYLLASRTHPGMRHAGPVRRELGVPTIFNLLGPLLNPVRPTHQLVGVADARFLPVLADVVAARGTRALVVRGGDGLDKLTTTTTSQVIEVGAGPVRHTVLDPRNFGLPLAEPAALRGGDAAANAAVVRAVLAGAPGPVRDVVLLNAAAARATTLDGDLEERIAAALLDCARAIDSGAAEAVLARLCERPVPPGSLRRRRTRAAGRPAPGR
ncbi:anthranilate phosphoribosyltransferase [Catellatospora sp. KI3]|uniref:anthranilate phosphoribosyltransferase n=1 Tax=Catellatospora sp. KI3 TaxID=3041620 RepID=UPI0024830FC0|nr:anthranilate phosphoribosyltransferase [Catellatospora sp. KI3]MDI1461219.1 anthranilate phosphoribosyltransferase [Catellatospora sp. KI3]